ncbi:MULTISPECIES: curli assembly chaperone CsgC [unclassified Serratia (in: enterobacteria)]|uniref:curli assembly chaperone CsgC n=1 Tax=unclassified Serratia (in: enterobacteria) TaxID=2647522 RepID=UPI00068BEB45|nr:MULTISPECIES: curli assembly chaperone CsgC [unclassified Serratia (in: enterobacteria)]
MPGSTICPLFPLLFICLLTVIGNINPASASEPGNQGGNTMNEQRNSSTDSDGSQLWIEALPEGDLYKITPMAQLKRACTCQIDVSVTHRGSAGQSTSRQQNTIALTPDTAQPLGMIKLSVNAGDLTQVVVTLTDGDQLHLEKQLTLPDKAKEAPHTAPLTPTRL